MSVAERKTMYGRPIALVAFGMCLASVSGCSKKPLSPGATKAEVLRRYGRPSGWYKISKADGMQIVSYWAGRGPEQAMPAGEAWVLEYKTKHGGKPTCFWIEDGIVTRIVEGPFLKSGE